MFKKAFLKTFVFLLPIAVPLFFFSRVVDAKAKGLYIEKPSYVISSTDGKYDYIVGGSSRVHNNFNTLLFDSVTGTKGFNIGYDGSGMAQVYLTLYFFLKNGNSAKVYLQQVEDGFLQDPGTILTYPFQDYFFLPYMDDTAVDECFRNSVSPVKYYMWKYLPYIKYAEFNNYYSLKKVFGRSQPDTGMIRQKGYNKLKLSHKRKDFPAASYPVTDRTLAVAPVNIFYLEKIKELCKQHNMSFILYSSPIYPPLYRSYTHTNLHDTLVGFASHNKIPYFNFMVTKEYETENLFYDETHLNAVGTDQFTRQLADTLKKIIHQEI